MLLLPAGPGGARGAGATSYRREPPRLDLAGPGGGGGGERARRRRTELSRWGHRRERARRPGEGAAGESGPFLACLTTS